MTKKNLKSFRKITALIVLSLITVSFLDLNGSLPGEFISFTLFFQFIPSIMKFTATLGLGAAGFIIVVVITLVFGRVYCSFLCPLGSSIDIISRLTGQKLRIKMSFSKPHNLLRHGILAAAILSVFLGSMWVVNLLDPYSNFGRIMAVLVKPLAAFMNNGLSRMLEILDNYTITPYTQPGSAVPVLLLVIVFTGMVVWMSVKRGRLYCNTLCPVGAFLGLISRFSYLKLEIDAAACVGCGKCECVCKSDCIDSKNVLIDGARCVSCYNCLDVCPKDAISLVRQWRPNPSANKPAKVDIQRRALMAATALFLTGFHKSALAVSKPAVYVKNKIIIRRKHPITPPGSLSIEHFTDKCTACHLCVSACPGKVLQSKPAGFGGKGFLMPMMINKHGYCNFNCNRCGEICPAGAILPFDLEAKRRIQVGKVKFVRENCIVVTQQTECGACSEHCPTKAVFMAVENNLRIPVVNPDVCIGCGACEYACPAIPNKAIYVEGNPIHLLADKPEVKKPKQAQVVEKFPF